MQNIKHRKTPTNKTLDPHLKISPSTSPIFIAVSKSQSLKQMKHYEWRKQTDHPIVRVTSCEVQNTNHESCIFKIRIEPLQLLVSELKNIPLFRTIYLLKEALFGFFTLKDFFGNFNVTSSMIAIDQNYKCKVWHNQDFSLNFPQSMSTQFTWTKVYEIFQEITLKTNTNKIFFQILKAKGKNFFQGLNQIELYVKSEKIIVPYIFRKTQERPPIPKVHRLLPKFMNSRRHLCSTLDLISSSLQKSKRKTNQPTNTKVSQITTAESHLMIKKIFTNSGNINQSRLLTNVEPSKQSQYWLDRSDEQQKMERANEKRETNEQPDGSEQELGFKQNNWDKFIGLDSAKIIRKSIHKGKPGRHIGNERKLDKLDQLGTYVGPSDSQNNQEKEEDEEEVCRSILQSSSASHIYK